MRQTFAQAIVSGHNQDDCFFLTADLGFMALEKVKSCFGSRFINVGVAEQNMIGVAAGLAREGYRVFAYSIAPFCYARPFEQIRNDICMARLPICLVGNGGGYAYGSMGPTHHALEDCAALNALGVRVLVPSFDEDVARMISRIAEPTYLRLGYDARPKGTDIECYDAWRQVLDGERGALVALGPLAGVAWQALLDVPAKSRPSVWAVTEFVGGDRMPENFWRQIAGQPLFVAEEHVQAGGLGMHIALAMAHKGVRPQRFVHRYAMGYPTGRFGSQEFHRAQSGLNVEGILSMIDE